MASPTKPTTSMRPEPRLGSHESHSLDDVQSTEEASIEKVGEAAAKEGGYRGWLTVLGSSLVYFASFGIISSFGFFQDYYREHFLSNVSASTISFVGTLQITLMNILAAPVGTLYDWYGVKVLYVLSGIGSVGALVGLSFLQSGKLWQVFLVQGFILGITIAMGAQPALVAVNQHFARRRALVMSIVAAAGSVGGVCFPLILARLNSLNGIGYGWSLRLVALMVALCYAIALLVSFWDISSHSEKFLRKILDFTGFLDHRYSVLCAGAFIAMLGQFVPYYYISSYTAEVHPTSPAKDYLLPLMNGCSFLGRILGGLAADEIGPANSVYPMTILSGLLCLVIWAVTSSVPGLICFVILYGLSSGVFIAVLPVIVAHITPAASMGGRIGAFYSVCSIAQLVGSPIGGALIKRTTASTDRTDGVAVERGDDASAYLGLILFSGITMLVGGIVVLASRLLHDRNIRARY